MIARALVLGLILAAPAAAARDLFVDNLAGYLVEARVLDAPGCAAPAAATGAMGAFERGLCLFHRADRQAGDEEAAIRALDEAQLRGLAPVPQQLATLASGLAHCALASRHLALVRTDPGGADFSRLLFCRERRAAQAELNAIRWNHALFDYADGMAAARSLDARLSEMAACHQGPLSPALDAECGQISAMSTTEINAFVDEAVGEAITRHFSGVESPITAMFSRKLGRAEGVVESAEAGIAGLETEAAVVNAEHGALQQAYEAARDAKMAPIYDNYRAAILRATAILDEFDRWKGGLFITADNVNLRPKIAERAGELAEESARANGLNFATTAQDLVAQVRRMLDREAQDRLAAARLCRIYYCELTSRRAAPDTIRACRRPALAQNPLCLTAAGTPASATLRASFDGTDHSADLAAFCQSAGVEPAFTVTGLSPAEAAACLAAMP